MDAKLPIILRGTGHYVPSEVLTNDFFASYLDTSDEWISTRTGIRERRRAAPDEVTSTISSNAARNALENAGMEPSELDLIIVCTATPNTYVPATACYVQDELGVSDIPAFDISAACSGFMYGSVVAANMIQSGSFNTALVIGAEILTRIMDFEDRNTAVLFGDAAGAAIISHTEDRQYGILYASLGTNGARTKDIWMPAGGSAVPASQTSVDERLHYLRMNGREVYKFAVHKMRKLIEEALKQTKLKADDIKMVVSHQSNLRIIESVRDKMGWPEEKFVVNIDRYGNTSAASIPVAIDEARRDGRIEAGDIIITVGLGAGLTWGVTVWRV